MEQEREPAQGRMKSRLWVVAGLGVGVGVGQAEPDPANRPALAPHSVAGSVTDSVVGDRLALDQSAASGFGPEAEAEAEAEAGAGAGAGSATEFG